MTFNVETSTSLPKTSMEHDMTTTARLDPDILIDGGLPKEPTELTVPTNPSPPEAAPAPSSSQINFNRFDFTSAPQPMAHARELQPSLLRSSTPHSDMQKYGRAKRLHDQGTNMTEMQVEKARLIPQDVLVTRIAMQEKEKSIELLKDEASGWLLMIQRD
jgi:hypothetical protein